MARHLNPKTEAQRTHNMLEDERAVSLHLRDILDDVEAGLRIWKQSSLNETWTQHDESLLRWLEGGEHALSL